MWKHKICKTIVNEIKFSVFKADLYCNLKLCFKIYIFHYFSTTSTFSFKWFFCSGLMLFVFSFAAPETQIHSKCSLLSDMFSLGLVICAVFNRGRPIIQAGNIPANYIKQLEMVSFHFTSYSLHIKHHATPTQYTLYLSIHVVVPTSFLWKTVVSSNKCFRCFFFHSHLPFMST